MRRDTNQLSFQRRYSIDSAVNLLALCEKAVRHQDDKAGMILINVDPRYEQASLVLPPGSMSLNSYVDHNSCFLVSSLPHLFCHTMSSHWDIYIYQSMLRIDYTVPTRWRHQSGIADHPCANARRVLSQPTSDPIRHFVTRLHKTSKNRPVWGHQTLHRDRVSHLWILLSLIQSSHILRQSLR
jgi:hypothetical protein